MAAPATTRRALFAAAPALALAAAAPLALAAAAPLAASASQGSDVQAHWSALKAKSDAFNKRRGVTDEEVNAFADAWDEELKGFIAMPIRSAGDAHAKLDAGLYEHGSNNHRDLIEEAAAFLRRLT